MLKINILINTNIIYINIYHKSNKKVFSYYSRPTKINKWSICVSIGGRRFFRSLKKGKFLLDDYLFDCTGNEFWSRKTPGFLVFWGCACDSAKKKRLGYKNGLK